MGNLETTIGIPPQLRAASFQPKTVNDDARTVEIVWTTGARVLRGGLFTEPYYEELSLDPKHVDLRRLNNGAPLLDAHSSDGISSVIGVVESARIENGKGYATVRFDRGEAGSEAFRKVKDGILQNVSVGYRVHKAEDTGSARDGVPIVMVTRWEPYELSLVPIGADDGAGTRGGDSGNNQCVFVKQEKRTMADDDNKTTSAEQLGESAAQLGESVAVAATRAAREARIASAKEISEAAVRAAEEARATERHRCAEIRKLGKVTKLGESWAQALIEGDVSVEAARQAAFDELTKQDGKFDIDGNVRVEAGDDERDKQLRCAEAWLVERTGTQNYIEAGKKRFAQKFRGVSAEAGEFRGMSPMDLVRHFLERSRVSTRGMTRTEMIARAFTMRSTNYQTLGDFPTLLENFVGKVLLGAYATQSNTWERCCKIEDVTDFRESGRYRTGSLPGLDVVEEHGEYTSGAVPDGAKYTISTQRYGKMFGLSEETIINDDMGALTQMVAEIGKASARTLENAFYGLLNSNGGLGPTMADSNPYFHSSRGNINSASIPLSVAGIDSDRLVMRSQLDPAGEDFLDLNPAILLVPDSLEGQGKEVNDAQYDYAAEDPSAPGKFMRPNRVRGLFRDVVGTPRLSGTRRYLFADPAQAAAFTVAFLQDHGRGPVISSQDGWRTDGVEWKVKLVAKVQPSDPKAAVTNDGEDEET